MCTLISNLLNNGYCIHIIKCNNNVSEHYILFVDSYLHGYYVTIYL